MRLDDGHLRSSSSPSDAVPFSEDLPHLPLVRKAVGLGMALPDPYATPLRLLKGVGTAYFGPLEYQQRRGATYRQLAAIAHAVGMSKSQRVRWYRIAEGIPLSRRLAGHILARLRKEAA